MRRLVARSLALVFVALPVGCDRTPPRNAPDAARVAPRPTLRPTPPPTAQEPPTRGPTADDIAPTLVTIPLDRDGGIDNTDPVFGGDAIGDAFGSGGLGATGTGLGGGGTGGGTIGIGSTGTLGHGAGTGSGVGYGSGAGRGLSSRGGRGPTVRPAPPTITGLVSPEAVRRVTLRNLGQVQHCYEQGLALNPTLAGRLVVRFIITGSGVVASSAAESNLAMSAVDMCVANAVRRWTFPAPEGGGVAVVNYPFNFSPGDGTGSIVTAPRLTAAAVADVDRRDNYLAFVGRHGAERERLSLDLSRRVRVRVLDAGGHPLNYARVVVSAPGREYEARTHADGWWDFFPDVSAEGFAGAATVRAEVEGGASAEASVTIPARGDRAEPVILRLPREVARPGALLDLAFVIDVTGSMEDELRYVNREVVGIVWRVKRQRPGADVRVSATFYRDRGDEARVQQIPFSRDVQGFTEVMARVHAEGGDDYPEDMNAGLEAAMNRLNWSAGAATRAIVLIADAPPHRYRDEQYDYRTAMREAARRGIRIVPVAASGADANVEYLFRAMGAFTSTPYVYLTDESGIGNPHREADTDRVTVEHFNDLLTRLIVSDLQGEGMHEAPPGTPSLRRDAGAR